MSEKVGKIVEKKLERVGRIYPIELRVGRRGSEGEVKG
jgi:hypothetical protein